MSDKKQKKKLFFTHNFYSGYNAEKKKTKNYWIKNWITIGRGVVDLNVFII